MSDQTQAEIKAQEFLGEYEGIAKLEDMPPVAINLIARDGTLIAIELVDEVTSAAHELASTYRTVPALVAAGAEPKKIAAVEARIPSLKETYERKLDLSNRLGELTDRAMALAEGNTKEASWEAYDDGNDLHEDNGPPPPKIKFEPDYVEGEGKITPIRVWPLWEWLFGKAGK